jgi:RNA polymerase sigma factor (sigma-70 family)
MVWSIVNRLHGMPFVRSLGDEEAYSVGCMTLIRCADGFNPMLGYRFSTYAYRAIKTDIIREAKRHAKQGKQLAGEGEIACESEEESDLDVEQLPRLLNRLSPRYREVVAMRFGLDGYDEMFYPEIGEALGVTGSRAQQIVTAAMKEMRR